MVLELALERERERDGKTKMYAPLLGGVNLVSCDFLFVKFCFVLKKRRFLLLGFC